MKLSDHLQGYVSDSYAGTQEYGIGFSGLAPSNLKIDRCRYEKQKLKCRGIQYKKDLCSSQNRFFYYSKIENLVEERLLIIRDLLTPAKSSDQ